MRLDGLERSLRSTVFFGFESLSLSSGCAAPNVMYANDATVPVVTEPFAALQMTGGTIRSG